jgi:hypothetical protein
MPEKRMHISATVKIIKRVKQKGFTVKDGEDVKDRGVEEILMSLGLNKQCDEFDITIHEIGEIK